MPPSTPSAQDDAHQQLLDQMDTYYLRRPFRNQDWKLGRRNKNIKQIVSEAQRREASVMATQNNSGASTPQPAASDGTMTPLSNLAPPVPNLSTLVLERNLQKAASANASSNLGTTLGPAVTYTNIESAPSLQTKKQYCDVTGLPARYTDPKTKLRYYNSEIFGVIRTFPPGVPDQYLAARGANVVLKWALKKPTAFSAFKLDYFNRIKGAIDDRIKEEQARQAKAQQTARPPQRRRPQAQDDPSARRSSRQRETPSISIGKSPDPSDFTIGDDESASGSRVATPQPQAETQNGPSESQSTKEEVGEQPAAEVQNGSDQKDSVSEVRPMLQDLPPEVKARLRKLDKLESKYAELFKAYKAAHARVQSIEPFEATLRENTPLTSILDPPALSEYLNQINMKSSMVLEELKRVSVERDEYKRKSETSEAEKDKLEHTVQDLKKQLDAQDVTSNGQSTTNVDSETPELNNEASSPQKDAASTVASPKSTSSRIPSLSLFSPRNKSKEEPTNNGSEDLFSFDSEVPRLEAELREKDAEVQDLSAQVASLKGDLKVTRESTESMARTLEHNAEELNSLRDAKETFDATEKDLKEKIQALESERKDDSEAKENEVRLKELNIVLEQTKASLEEAQDRIQLLETQEKTFKDNLRVAEEEVESLRTNISQHRSTADALEQKLQQKDDVNKDLEDSLAFAKKAEREHEETCVKLTASEKRIQAMQGVMDNLRSQVDKADLTITQLRSEIAKVEQEHEVISNDVAQIPLSQGPEASGNSSTKKKNKKKKKGKGQSTSNNDADASESLDVSAGPEPSTPYSHADAGNGERVSELTEKVAVLTSELNEKKAMIDRLSAKIKDQEALQEEIETLRDDLLHQGEEHVEARDALKTAQAEQQQLMVSKDDLEKELVAAQNHIKAGAEALETQSQSLAELEALRSQYSGIQSKLEAESTAHEKTKEDIQFLENQATKLQTDLKNAEQLATSRFKDITDLKSLLEKAQPEIRNLKKEVGELTSAKDELKNKSGELSRLEQKHEEVKTELKNLGKRLSNQDAEVKDLKAQIEKGTKAKEIVERELQAKESELHSAEARRDGAIEMREQVAKDLAQSKQENETLRGKLRDLSDQLSSHERHISSLKEEISLKSALHTTSQSLVQSLRDQMHELNTTTRELTSRSESKEEELAEAQRMLSERTRESQTMRTLLNQSESGTETRLRDMKERMEAAMEERDRLEDENAVASRRLTRELNEAQNKLRDSQRALKNLETERDDLEIQTRQWRKLREDLEHTSKSAEREAEETRNAMKSLREALDESERHVNDIETQKADLRKQVEETSDRVEKLSKANKNLTEEIKCLQAQTGIRRPSTRPGGVDSGLQSSRTSIDSNTARSPAPPNSRLTTSSVTSLPRSETPTSGSGQAAIDYVYLKNVLLQFLSQKDKGHQRQLIPVLGMLLHFDDKDQQRWNAAITAR